jgi:FKBP-type peptidyl-prolyl cis-trans isomerase FkpA
MVKNAFLICLVTGFLACCGDSRRKNAGETRDLIPENRVKEQFMRANQQQVQKENDEINYYVKTHGLPFKTAGSGIRFFVYKPSTSGDSIRAQMPVTMEYTVSLLDGTLCYSSAEDGPKDFIVEYGDVESGIHKGVQYLKRGDKALLIIPSALAHGLLGDMKKIPPQMPIIYNIHVR